MPTSTVSQKTAGMLGVPILGEVPIDPKVVVGGDTGEPIFSLDPKSPATDAFRKLASDIDKQMLAMEAHSPGMTGIN